MVRLRGAVFVATLSASALVIPVAHGEFPGTKLTLLSHAAGGGTPNGASRNPVISQDRRFGRMVAFESDATNIVSGASGGTNVYVMARKAPFPANGTAWRPGRLILASRGMGGAPANGPSTRPFLAGMSRQAPHCVAFVSAASNLVPGDTNGTPDAFVRDLLTGHIRRVSVDSNGHQSSGSVSEVAVDGKCTRAAFVSDAGDLALTATSNASWKSARTGASPAGRRQVYVHFFGGSKGIDRAVKRLTALVSATDGGSPGDADSHSLALCTNGEVITFASEAGNLAAGDSNGATDVYQRSMKRRYGRRVHGRKVQYLRMDTRLISPGTGGPSQDPASNVDGSIVAFSSTSAAAVGGASQNLQVIKATVSGIRPRYKLISRTRSGGPGNGPSTSPSLTAAGAWVVFASAASNVGVLNTLGADRNGVEDVQLFTSPNESHWVLAQRGATTPSTNPMTSPHGNYVVFERASQVYLLWVGKQ